MLSSIDTKTKVDWARSAVVVVATAAIVYTSLINRVSNNEEDIEDLRSEMSSKVSKTELNNMKQVYPTKMEMNSLQNTLDNIEEQLDDALPRIRTMGEDIAVLKATKATSGHGR